MSIEEYIEELHKFREKRSEELSELSPEERCEKMNEEGLKLAKKLGLNITPPASREKVK